MATPLNPRLFQALQRVFGRVRVSNEGQKMIANYVWNEVTQREQLIKLNSGEQYHVCCDRCTDTRFRLYISYRFGVRDEKGRRNLWLAYCQNESSCYGTYEAREALYEVLSAGGSVLAHATIREGVEAPNPREMEMPGPVYPLHGLPPEHPANRYLAGRGYNPERLGKFYGVCYCAESKYYLASNRIIVPMYFQQKLRGWQARYIGNLNKETNPDAPPKWWTAPGMERGKLLYNFDNAASYGTCIVVEGPADVWSVGPMGVACLGAGLTPYQRQLFVETWGDGNGVLLLDADLFQNTTTRRSYDALFQELAPQFQRGLARVVLPDGADPGDFDRGFLRDFVAREAKAQGVRVSWERK